MTIAWHIDDLKVSHNDKDVVDTLSQCTNETYEYITKLKTPRVKVNDYLAKTQDYTTPEEVKFYKK